MSQYGVREPPLKRSKDGQNVKAAKLPYSYSVKLLVDSTSDFATIRFLTLFVAASPPGVFAYEGQIRLRQPLHTIQSRRWRESPRSAQGTAKQYFTLRRHSAQSTRLVAGLQVTERAQYLGMSNVELTSSDTLS